MLIKAIYTSKSVSNINDKRKRRGYILLLYENLLRHLTEVFGVTEYGDEDTFLSRAISMKKQICTILQKQYATLACLFTKGG